MPMIYMTENIVILYRSRAWWGTTTNLSEVTLELCRQFPAAGALRDHVSGGQESHPHSIVHPDRDTEVSRKHEASCMLLTEKNIFALVINDMLLSPLALQKPPDSLYNTNRTPIVPLLAIGSGQ